MRPNKNKSKEYICNKCGYTSECHNFCRVCRNKMSKRDKLYTKSEVDGETKWNLMKKNGGR